MGYQQSIREVIAASWFTVDPEVYVYARTLEVIDPAAHLMVIRDAGEITVVTAVGHLPRLGRHERNPENWRLLNIRCGRPFYCVGFIASIADALASAGIDLVLASTFSNDLVLVMERDLAAAERVLLDTGFRRAESRIESPDLPPVPVRF